MRMSKAKRKALEAKGWKVADADEFLGLSPEESAYIRVKLALSRRLRTRRQRSGLTQIELARMLRSSQSRVAKMEAGDPSVSVDLLIRSLLALGLTPKDLGRTIASQVSNPAT